MKAKNRHAATTGPYSLASARELPRWTVDGWLGRNSPFSRLFCNPAIGSRLDRGPNDPPEVHCLAETAAAFALRFARSGSPATSSNEDDAETRGDAEDSRGNGFQVGRR